MKRQRGVEKSGRATWRTRKISPKIALQPRGLLRRKLKIQRAEGNFGDEEQGLRVERRESGRVAGEG